MFVFKAYNTLVVTHISQVQQSQANFFFFVLHIMTLVHVIKVRHAKHVQHQLGCGNMHIDAKHGQERLCSRLFYSSTTLGNMQNSKPSVG